jgi:molybdopterin/thiamine biosynthesis adenylyltransferase
LTNLNEFCHKKGIGFIHAGVLGLYAHCFTDFGEGHTIYDKDGKTPELLLVKGIRKPSEAKKELEILTKAAEKEMSIEKKKKKKLMDPACLKYPTIFIEGRTDLAEFDYVTLNEV